jgi:hypothetical protein
MKNQDTMTLYQTKNNCPNHWIEKYFNGFHLNEKRLGYWIKPVPQYYIESLDANDIHYMTNFRIILRKTL